MMWCVCVWGGVVVVVVVVVVVPLPLLLLLLRLLLLLLLISFCPVFVLFLFLLWPLWLYLPCISSEAGESHLMRIRFLLCTSYL